jgi:hypothetical protein
MMHGHATGKQMSALKEMSALEEMSAAYQLEAGSLGWVGLVVPAV